MTREIRRDSKKDDERGRERRERKVRRKSWRRISVEVVEVEKKVGTGEGRSEGGITTIIIIIIK